MTKIAIVYHSGFGHTKRVAEFVQAGALETGAQAVLITTDEAIQNMDILDPMDAIIFGCPTYMGGVSAPFKAFADATSGKWFAQGWKDKIAAGFTNSGGLSGDKLSSLQYMVHLACQHGMIWTSAALPLTASVPGNHGILPDQINRLSTFTGLMTQSDNTDPAQTPAPGDIESARLFGKRVAEVTQRWNR